MKAKVSFIIRQEVELDVDDNITTADLIDEAADELTQGFEYSMDMWEYDGYVIARQ